MTKKSNFYLNRNRYANPVDRTDRDIINLFNDMSFETRRDDYLSWVKRWKTAYRDITNNIKSLRSDIYKLRDVNRRDMITSFEWEISFRQSETAQLSNRAKKLIEMRHINKILAARNADRDYNGENK